MRIRAGRQSGQRTLLLPSVGVIVFIVAAAALIWPITDLIASHDVGAGLAGSVRAEQLQAAREAVRTQLLTLGAGIFAAGAVVFTARNFTLTRQGQVSDRYSKEIDQLGSDRIDVRIGGIYALEGVARDSPKDHATVLEVLCAFVRERSTEQQVRVEIGEDRPKLAADVQAALTVIGRRNVQLDIRRLDFSRAVRRGAVLDFGNFSGARFDWADLRRVQCTGADFSDASFIEANLSQSFFGGVTFIGDGADAHVNLQNAARMHTEIVDTNLKSADLRGALPYEANLAGAFLWDADFTDAKFRNTNLANAHLAETRWPEGEGSRMAGSWLLMGFFGSCQPRPPAPGSTKNSRYWLVRSVLSPPFSALAG